jgi:hypothetical protein
MKVYLMEDPAAGLVKVGVSDVPFRRMAFLQTQRKEQIFLRHEHDAGGRTEAYRIERDAHILLADSREEGEWFRCSLDAARRALDAAIIEPIDRQRQAGTKIPVSIRLTEEELALLNKQAAIYGGQARAIVAGLCQLSEPTEITREVLLAALRERLEDD